MSALLSSGLAPEHTLYSDAAAASAYTHPLATVDDTRLYVNCRAATSLHVNISSLAVAWCNKKQRGTYFGMMLDDRDLVEQIAATVPGAAIEDFKNISCLGLKVPLETLMEVMPAVRESWHRAILIQVHRTRKNGEPFYNAYHNNHHFPFFYDVLTDLRLREAIAAATFPFF